MMLCKIYIYYALYYTLFFRMYLHQHAMYMMLLGFCFPSMACYIVYKRAAHVPDVMDTELCKYHRLHHCVVHFVRSVVSPSLPAPTPQARLICRTFYLEMLKYRGRM